MNKKDYNEQIIWIIGASSGIGSFLARELSTRGAVLALSARRKDELDSIKTHIGEQHKVFALDVTDLQNILNTAQAIQVTFGRIDRIIFLAAAYIPMKIDELDITVTKQIVDINIMGAFNLLYAVLPILKTQKSTSQIALCGSVAGYIGLPGSQPYSATKAAIINLAESLYAESRDKVDIKLISPGFVRTRLTDKNDFHMPMIMKPEQAAREIADGLLTHRFEIHFPRKLTFFLKTLCLLPYAISLRLARNIKT